MNKTTSRRVGSTTGLVLAACLIYGLSSVIRANYGILLGPISSNSGVDYASVSFVLAVAQLSFGVMQPVFGVLAMKRSSPFVLRCGIALMTVGLLLLPWCKSLWALLLVLELVLPSGTAALSFGIVMGGLTPKLPRQVVSTASGVVTASSGVGSTVFSPVIQALCTAAGLLGTATFLSLPVLLLFPVSVYLCRRTGDSAPIPEKEKSVRLTSLVWEAVRNKDYQCLLAGFFTCGFHMAIIETHFFTQVTACGFTERTAAYAFSVYGIATLVGCVISGGLVLLNRAFHISNAVSSHYFAKSCSQSSVSAPRPLCQILYSLLFCGILFDKYTRGNEAGTMKLQTAPKQVQVLSPKMILSMEILQMGTQELLEHIEATVQENPVLETAESSDGYNEPQSLSREMEWLIDLDPQNRHYYRQDTDFPHLNSAAAEQTESLYDHVVSQLRSMELGPQLASCTELLAGCLNHSGWIEEDISLLAEEFGKPLEELERALAVVQSLEPAGVGARSLSECLCLQLKRRMPVDRLALSIAADYLEPLSKSRYGVIAQALGVSQKDVRRAAGAIRSLEPRPGAVFAAGECAGYIIPDIIVAAFPGHLEPMSNQCFLPSLSISSYYTRLMKECNDETVHNYLRDKVQQAKSTIWAIEQRRNTLLACAGCILEIQEGFFRKGPGHLVPMSLSDVAHRIGMHESTVSRAVRDKYLQCSMGIYPMSRFFVRQLGTAADEAASSPDLAKALLKQLITQEDKHKPLSDQKLCELMAEQGCTLSRRTVAKYRDELNIPGMAGRRC